MVNLERDVAEDPQFSLPIISHWNVLMAAVFPAELSGLRWTSLEVYPHVDMVQGDLDVQSLCCDFPPDHLHVRCNLPNGNTLYYGLENWSDKQLYRVLKAWRGQQPFWNARVYLFEVSPSAIARSPLLREKLRVFNATNPTSPLTQWSTGETQAVERGKQRGGDSIYLPNDRFLSWAQKYRCPGNVSDVTHQLVINRGHPADSINLRIPEQTRKKCLELLENDLSRGKFYPLFEVVPVKPGAEDTALLRLFFELFAPSELPWDDIQLLEILKNVWDSIKQFLRTDTTHRLYVSTNTAGNSSGRKHRSLLIHPSIVVHTRIAQLVEAYLIRSLRGSGMKASIKDVRWEESIIDPICGGKNNRVLAPMLHTAAMVHCPQCCVTSYSGRATICWPTVSQKRTGS